MPELLLAPHKSTPLDYIITILPVVVIQSCLALVISSALPDFLHPGEIGYSKISLGEALFNWIILLVPFIIGLLFCRLRGRRAGVITGSVLAFLSFGWFFIQLFLLGGNRSLSRAYARIVLSASSLGGDYTIIKIIPL